MGQVDQSENGEVCNGQVMVPDILHHPTFLADLLKQAKNHINTLTPVQAAEMKAIAELQNFQQSCKETNHAGDLNQLTDSLGKDHAYYQSMRQALISRAQEMKCSFDKQLNKWINPPQFRGITDEQRDYMQNVIDERGLDTKTVCEHFSIDNLLSIEATKFDAVINQIQNMLGTEQ